MFLIQIIYSSEVSSDIGPKDIEQILTASRKNNAQKHISGLLAFDGRYFLQALEGLRSEVNQWLETISRDPRHKDLCIMHYREITERDFCDWNMAYVGQSKFNKALIMRFSGNSEFKPKFISGASALALLKALKSEVEK